MRCRRLALALSLTSLLLAGCSADPAPPPSPPSPTPAAKPPLSLVVIGDSIPFNSQADCPSCRGFVTRYAEALGKATGREVTVKNRSEHTGLTLPGLMESLPGLRAEVSEADAVLVAIAHNSFPLNEERPCGSAVDPATGAVQDWSKVDAGCAARASAAARPMYDELYSTVAGWRAERPTILLTLNRYNDWVGFDQAALTTDQAARTVVLHDAWNEMLCQAASAHRFGCVDVYHAFNGADGTTPSGDLLADDYTHPSQSGNDLIARLLTEKGFAPVG